MKAERENYPFSVKIIFNHNHSLSRADFLKYLDVNEETKTVYWEMFVNGILPSSAHSERKRNIKAEFPED